MTIPLSPDDEAAIAQADNPELARKKLILKNRIIAAAPAEEGYSSVDLGSICLTIAITMIKANGVELERFLDSARTSWERTTPKGTTPPLFTGRPVTTPGDN